MTIQLVYSNPHQLKKPKKLTHHIDTSEKKQLSPSGITREEHALMLVNDGYQAFWNCPEEDQHVNRAVFIAELKLFMETEWLNND